MKKLFKRLLTAAMASCMIATAFAGCQQQGAAPSGGTGSQTGSTEDSSTSGSGEIETIEFYGFAQNPSNAFFKWQQDYFAEKIGVNVTILPGDAEKLQTMLSAGNLPDMGMYAVNGSLAQAIQGGHLMDLTPYEKDIPNYTEKWPQSVQYSKDYLSNGTGKLYGLIGQLGVYNAYALDTGTYAINVRWDIYEKAGKPEATDMYSFLDAAVKMKEIYQKTPDGLETYMSGLFPDAGGALFSNIAYKYLEVNGATSVNQSAVYDIVNDKVEYVYEKGGLYYQSLKWLATANRMGLIDPDSMTQDYQIAQGKINDSDQYYVTLRGNYCDRYNTLERVNAEEPKGFLPLVWEGMHSVVSAKETKIGGNTTSPYCISSTTEKRDACLKFANLLFDEDALMVMYGGPQGELWDIQDGKYVLTDAAEEFRVTGKHTFGTGEEGSDWWANWGMAAATSNSKYPDFTFRITDSVSWAMANIEESKIHDMYEEYYGKRRPIEVFEEYDAIVYQPEWKKLIETMPSELEDIQNNAKGVIDTLQWQAVMTTKSDEEFNQIFDQIITQAEELDVPAIYEWTEEQVAKAKDAFQKYQ